MLKVIPTMRPVKGLSFVGCKVHTVPSQSLSLKEIIKRFIRREALPVSQEGIYETRFGDLEKIQHADITEKMERVAEIKSNIKTAEKRMKDKHTRANTPPTPPTPPPAPDTHNPPGEPTPKKDG